MVSSCRRVWYADPFRSCLERCPSFKHLSLELFPLRYNLQPRTVTRLFAIPKTD
jgi:hypothetical protein